MPSYDPFALLRLISSMRSALSLPVAPLYVLIIGLGSVLVLSYAKPDLTPGDIVAAIIYCLLVLWIGRQIRIVRRRQKELKKIYANRHRGDRLNIQERCAELLGPSNNYHGRSDDDTHEMFVTTVGSYSARAYHIVITTRELYIDEESLENCYEYETYAYVINPTVCAIERTYTKERRDPDQASGEGVVTERLSITCDWLEGDDITRIVGSFNRKLGTIRRPIAGNES